MLNLIKGELYKAFNRPVYMLITGIFCFGIIACGISFKWFGTFTLNGQHSENPLIDVAVTFVMVTVWLLTMYTDLYIEEYKENTLKNITTSDLPRWKVYLGKYISQIVLFLIMFVSAMTTLIITSFLLGYFASGDYSLLIVLILKFLVAMPIYFGALAIYDLITIIVKKENPAIFTILFTAIGSNMILTVLAHVKGGIFNTMYSYFVFGKPLMDLVNNDLSSEIIFRNIVSGTFTTIIFLVIGVMVFNRQEIK